MGRAIMNGISVLIRIESLLSPSTILGPFEKMVLYEAGSKFSLDTGQTTCGP